MGLPRISATFDFVKCSTNERVGSSLLKNVLDAEECQRQISIIRSNFILGMRFADAGIRIPRGILTGNIVDLGNYHQCLDIEERRQNIHIQGKYCSIRVPMNQTFRFPRAGEKQEWSITHPAFMILDKVTPTKIQEYNSHRRRIKALKGYVDALEGYEDMRSSTNSSIFRTVFTLGVCVPKPCSTQQAITSLLFNVTAIGFNYTEDYCRLKNDKPWTGADTVAVVIFFILGFITLLSTSYDLCYRFYYRTDIKSVNLIYQSYSVYTNSLRLMSYSFAPENLNCIDGIRAISMMWIIHGHTYSAEPYPVNPFDVVLWTTSTKSLWVTVGSMAVDTFFALSGILVVYATARKMNGLTLLKNLHWFYISRLVRITPLLAVTILLQASYFNHMADGPLWQNVQIQTNRCRTNWWTTLLNIQNLINPRTMCAGHSWYVAIDSQLYILSPIVLFWVLSGKRRNAWFALVVALLAVLVASTIYSFNLNMQAEAMVPSRRGDERLTYMVKYYYNTLSRASPFFVGLIFGYILHIHRGQKVQMTWVIASILWAFDAILVCCIIYFHSCIKQFGWNNQFMDNFMNSFMRPAWAIAVGMVILTCEHGYGGPVNWFLSLYVWRLPARLSYGMYLFHFPLMYSINGTMTVPIYFSVGLYTFKFLSYFTLSFGVSLFFTVLVELPISVLYKQIMKTVQNNKAISIEHKIDEKYDIQNKNITLYDETKVEDEAADKFTVPAITIE